MIMAINSRASAKAFVAILLVCSLLSGCGGGEASSDSVAASDSTLDGQERALAVAVQPGISVATLTKVSETRISRTVYDYVFKVTLANAGPEKSGVEARLTGAGTGTIVIDGVAIGGVIGAKANVTPEDTITLRHDRTYAFDQSKLVWAITGSEASVVTISGYVWDEAVANSTVQVIGLASNEIIGTATSDTTGLYTVSGVLSSKLSAGYKVVATGGTMAGAAVTGSLQAVYSSLHDKALSNVTLLTSAVVRLAERQPSQNPLSEKVTQVISAALSTGRIMSPDFWELNAPGISLAGARDAVQTGSGDFKAGVDVLSELLSVEYPAITRYGTICTLSRNGDERLCTARIAGASDSIRADSGTVLATVSAAPSTNCDRTVLLAYTANSIHLRGLVSACGTNPDVTLQLPEVSVTTGVPDGIDTNTKYRSIAPTATGIQPAIYVSDGVSSRVVPTISPTKGGLSAYSHLTKLVYASVERRYGARLTSASPTVSAAGAPVLLIHGFQAGGVFGVDGTWGTMPDLIRLTEQPNFERYQPYIFNWRTISRFEDAADDLNKAIAYISAQHGGKKVHVVAHSFGGVLARLLLQKPSATSRELVSSLTTVGTPHSGILKEPSVVSGVNLPKGTEFLLIGECKQVSCYQAGAGDLPNWLIENLSIADGRPLPGRGYVSAKIQADSGNLPKDLRIQVLIGQQFGLVTQIAQNGDGLITYNGQRYASNIDPRSDLLFQAERAAASDIRLFGSGVSVTERVLGVPLSQSAVPGLAVPLQNLSAYMLTGVVNNGYGHTKEFFGVPEVQLPDECKSSSDCQQDAWVHIRSLLLAIEGGPAATNFPARVDSINCTAPVSGAMVTCAVAGKNLPPTQFLSDASGGCLAPPAMLQGGTPAQRQFSCIAGAQGGTFNVSINPVQLGAQTGETPRFFPLTIGAVIDTTPSVIAVAGGLSVAAAVRSDGGLWTWGSNNQGSLGDGSTTSRLVPKTIGTGYSKVVAGEAFVVALKSDRSLWAWGANTEGQLGDGTRNNSSVPKQIDGFFKTIAVGTRLVVAIKTDDSLWAWGEKFGTLVPTKVGDGFTAIAAGNAHALALKSDGSLWAWGRNSSGQIGDGTVTNRPIPIQIGSGYSAIAAANDHSLALKTDGSLWMWGGVTSLVQTDTSGANSVTPKQVGVGFTKISTSYIHSLALKGDGTLWAWGDNRWGNLGTGTTVGNFIPTQIGVNYIDICAGSFNSFAIKGDGTLWAWGSNGDGALGDGTTIDRYLPTPVRFP